MPLESPIAFFSYSRDDSPFVLQLAKDLRAGGAAAWLDQIDIRPGQRWDEAIEKALGNCPNLIVVLSPTSVESTNVMDEVSFAIDEKKTVIPVLYQTCKIPFRLRRVEYVDARTDYNLAVSELLNMLGIERSAPYAASAAAPEPKISTPPAPPEKRPEAPPLNPVVPAPAGRKSPIGLWIGGATAALVLLAIILLSPHKSPPANATDSPPAYSASSVQITPAQASSTPPAPERGGQQEIDTFISNFMDASQGPTVVGLRPYFTDQISPYFSLKSATWADIAADKEKYFQHFPTVHFTLLGEPAIRRVNDNEEIIDYNIHYSNIRSDGTSSEGNSHQTMDLVLTDGAWKIAGISEALSR
jgi:hypothetical protein